MFLTFGILRLSEVRGNLAANFERPPLMRNYAHATAGGRPSPFGGFPPGLAPVTQSAR